MPMSGPAMASAVSSSLQGAFPGMTSDQIAQLNSSLGPLCDAIVTYIQVNALVEATGANSAGPVVSTGTVT